jgi:hypothetical protein
MNSSDMRNVRGHGKAWKGSRGSPYFAKFLVPANLIRY